MESLRRRDIWKRNSRSTCEVGKTNLLRNIQQDTKKNRYKKGYPESIRKWKSQWEETTKGGITKEFLPNVERTLAVNLNLNPNVTTIMTGHGNIRSYLTSIKNYKKSRVSIKNTEYKR